MKPLIKRIHYILKKGEEDKEFVIKEKDYGKLVIYDIFFGDLFLFAMSVDGSVWLGNWEAVKNEPVSLDKKALSELCAFIKNIRL